MTWEYALIYLIVGFIIGALVVFFSNTKLNNQKDLEANVKKKNNELEKYRKELIRHFTHSAELLDNLLKDYHQFCNYMNKSANKLMNGIPIQNNLFSYRLTKSELNNDEVPINLPPKDYSEGSSDGFKIKYEKKDIN
ncbi:MAG: ZapG family protein [Arsenophonus sp.]